MRLEEVNTTQNTDSVLEISGDNGEQQGNGESSNTLEFTDGSDYATSYIDSMSLNSETLQDFGSLVSLPPGTISGIFNSVMESDDGTHTQVESEGSQTIVSSEPSNVFIPPPDGSAEQWTGSPHPLLASESIRSLSTVCTDILPYEDISRVQETANTDDKQDHRSVSSVTTLSSQNGSVNNDPSGQLSVSSDGHNRVSFVAVANHLMRESVRGGRWYGNFSERDWDQFQRVAKMVVASLEPPRPVRMALPPSPPANISKDIVATSRYCASECLPESFICPLCSDAIVGALTLDCGCPISTVCTLCWEKYGNDDASRDICDRLDYVWVDNRRCPSCRKVVQKGVPCHALDVAILRIVGDLPTEEEAIFSLKHCYYERLGKWGEEVVRRHEEHDRQEMVRQDELLAQLIQNEEKMIWERQRQREASVASSSRFLLFGQAAVAVVVATVASMGVNALARR